MGRPAILSDWKQKKRENMTKKDKLLVYQHLRARGCKLFVTRLETGRKQVYKDLVPGGTN